jgi:hypothetical protein
MALVRENCAVQKYICVLLAVSFFSFFLGAYKVQKGVFFNTKYLPKHQGVSCCDLLHLQYLSDASFFRFFTVQVSASRRVQM